MRRNPFLLIWDIDGTLISCKGSGKRAMTLAFNQFYGVKDGFSGVDMAGRVDYSILQEACIKHGIKFDNVEKFYSLYGSHLENDMSNNTDVEVLTGVEDVLEETHGSDEFINIIGTGNCEVGGWLKLRKLKLDSYFRTGGFGSLHLNRNDVIESAINEARNLYDLPFDDLDRIYVIGDTPADIASSKSLSVKSVAVATGGYSVELLKEYSPDYVLDSLKELKQFFRIFRS